MMKKDSATYRIQAGWTPQAIPLIDQAVFDTLLKGKELFIYCRRDGFLVGIKSDGSLVAVRDIFSTAQPVLIDVTDANTEAAFLVNAEKAWREKHGKER